MVTEAIAINKLGDKELALEGESSFLGAEEFRQKQGFNNLKRLLSLDILEARAILGIDGLPSDFEFETDWLKPTGEHFVKTKVVTSGGLEVSVMGIRYQNNVVNRSGEESEISCFVGGGVRASFVSGDARLEPQDTPGRAFSSQRSMFRKGFVPSGIEFVNEGWDIIQSENGGMIDNIIDIDNLPVQLDCLKQEGAALATAMVPKIMGLEFSERLCDLLGQIGRKDLIKEAGKIILGGGAKADIFISKPDGMEKSEELELIFKALEACGYEWAKMGVVGPKIDRMAGDRNTTGAIDGRPVIEGLLDGVRRALRERGATEKELSLAQAAVTGKREGGLKVRADATGLGCWESLRSYAEQKGIKLEGKSVFFRGCGGAARRAIVEAHKAGMRVTGISDIHSILHCEGGFTDKDAHELFEVSVNQRGNIADWARIQIQQGRDIEIYAEPDQEDFGARLQLLSKLVGDYWQAYSPEVIFESAAQMTLNQETAKHVPDGVIVVEGANGATTPIAAGILSEKNVTRIPGINCNAGGVFVSWLEWAQGIFDVKFPTEFVENAVAEMMSSNMKATLKLIQFAEQRGISLTQEEAFYSLAIARGLSARRQFMEKTNG